MPKEKGDNKKINIMVRSVASASDGYQFSIDKQTGAATLIFFQMVPSSGENNNDPNAIAIAHVRLPLEQFKQLGDSIANAVQFIEKEDKTSA